MKNRNEKRNKIKSTNCNSNNIPLYISSNSTKKGEKGKIKRKSLE